MCRWADLTANQHDAIAAVELALAEAARLAGGPLADLAPRDAAGAVQPLVTIVTDNGGPFRSFRFEAFIATRPELRHVRTRVRTPGQNVSRERGFGSLQYEKLFLEEIPNALDLVRHAEDYRLEYNTVRPHEALAWNRPYDVPTGQADPLVPQLSRTRKPANYLTRDSRSIWHPSGTTAVRRDATTSATESSGRRASLLSTLNTRTSLEVVGRWRAEPSGHPPLVADCSALPTGCAALPCHLSGVGPAARVSAVRMRSAGSVTRAALNGALLYSSAHARIP
ncbi:integrase core domain-containing protein [Actinacidiphila glaucinigra]|uniref:integrase core domain-containing protein n=1 Tax=Actinacidiphila glaucinigra TaxID=235986 RepID=UPI0033A2E8C8